MRSIPLIFIVIFFLCSCGKEDSLNENGANFESWYPRYNNYISSWLTEEVSAREKAISELNKELEIARSKDLADDEETKKTEDLIKKVSEQIVDKKREYERF